MVDGQLGVLNVILNGVYKIERNVVVVSSGKMMQRNVAREGEKKEGVEYHVIINGI